ncbi:dysbindin-like [Dunckerocampus dactyliophorus]|uniref:dysbindin-like n=1 Tax=Dunckerocampus dactyliophorus TaxID=161453 RepID=UPI002404FDCB|nr:dysbindin-like [Dunckerocampus dactyliophorus]
MEVNVDLLDQVELIDISDQEAVDVFLSAGGKDNILNSTMPVNGNTPEGAITNELFRHVIEGLDLKSLTSSTFSNSSCESQTNNANIQNTCGVVQHNQGAHSSTIKQTAAPPKMEAKGAQRELSIGMRCHFLHVK